MGHRIRQNTFGFLVSACLGVTLWLSTTTAPLAGKPPFPNELKYPNIIQPDVTFGRYGTNAGEFIDPLAVAFGPHNRLYVLDAGNSRVQILDRMGRALAAFGAPGSASGQFIAPESLAISARGTVAVADTGNNRVQLFDADGKFLKSWGAYGTASGQFRAPRGVAITNDRVLVADTQNQRVQVFNHAGRLLFAFGRYGAATGEFNDPVSIAVGDDGAIYVSDQLNNRIQKFDAHGRFVSTWGKWGSYSGLLATPVSIAFHQDRVYVADLINHRVQVFNGNGEFLYQWGRHPNTPHEGNGRLHYPLAVAANPIGSDVAVCEPVENRCQIFGRKDIDQVAVKNVDDSAWWDKATRFHYGTSASIQEMYLAVAEPDTHAVLLFDIGETEPKLIRRFGGEGTQPGRFKNPEGVAIDVKGQRLFVADMGNHRIQVFGLNKGKEGDFVAAFGARGQGAKDFNKPGKITIDKSGNLYILDAGNGRVKVYNSKLESMRTFGKQGKGAGELNTPTAIAFSPKEDTMYILDSYNHRVQMFDRSGKPKGSFGGAGTGNSQFIWPYGLDVDKKDGNVFVSDAGGQKIKKFSPDGKFIAAYGEYGSGPGQFYKPKGIAFSDRNILYVLDFGNHRGQMMTTDGKFVGEWGLGELSKPDPKKRALLDDNQSLLAAGAGVFAFAAAFGVLRMRKRKKP